MIFLNFFNRFERRAFFERVTGSTVRCSMSQEHAKFAVEKELDESVKARNLQLGASKLLPSPPPPLPSFFSPPISTLGLCAPPPHSCTTAGHVHGRYGIFISAEPAARRARLFFSLHFLMWGSRSNLIYSLPSLNIFFLFYLETKSGISATRAPHSLAYLWWFVETCASSPSAANALFAWAE